MIKRFAVILVAVIGLGSMPSSFARTWTQAATGRKIEADPVGVEGANVVLRLNDGQTVKVPVNTLSAEDQEFVKTMAPKGGGSPASGTDWPAFRGADGTGISPDTGLLEKWPSDGPEKIWTYDKAGMGYSGFAVVDGRLYTQGTRDTDVTMICVDADSGKKIWSRSYAEDDSKGYNAGWGNGPRGAPSVNDGKVYGLGPKGILVCIDAEKGSVVWKKDLIKDFSGEPGKWGYSETPIVDGEKLIVAPGGNKAGIVALNKDTGDVIWTADEVQPGMAEYATIVVSEMNGKRQYIKFFEKIVASVDAETGRLLWQGDFPKGKVAVIPTPIVDGNQVYVSAGYSAGCRAFEISSSNQVKELWTNNEMSNHHGGVIKFGDHIYGFDNGKGLVCQDWDTGKLTWMNKDRQFLSKGAVHIADGMIYALNEQNGALTLISANPEGYKEHGRFILDPQSPNRNPQGRIWTHPLVIGGKLYLRDQEFIHCYDVKK
ncbi:MAG: PQQ-binding-like beta-propeller repeat protein [Verrucomicrobiales bacterium]|nr:PQQ-binding-like beta-propeller repeat protein [Verrucomicrobiales bacterium]